MMRPFEATAVAVIALASCSRDEASASSASVAAPLSAVTLPNAASAPANDGTDPDAPLLAPDDMKFIDVRGGWGWSDRCFNEITQGKLGWARAACDRALALPQVDPKARAALLYNEGVIAKKSGDVSSARSYFGQSLALRAPNDPGKPEVETQFVSVGGAPESWSDRAKAAADTMCSEQGETISRNILSITHPSGERGRLMGCTTSVEGEQLVSRFDVSWKGAVLGNHYTTSVEWRCREAGDLGARVISDTSLVGVEAENAMSLEQYFRTTIFPILLQNVHR